jgi:hypothetical protein
LLRDPDGPAPRVKGVEHVGFTELDTNRAATRPFTEMAIEVTVDSFVGNFEGNPLLRPTHDVLERRSRDANEMPVIFATEVSFDVAAVTLNHRLHRLHRLGTRAPPQGIRAA